MTKKHFIALADVVKDMKKERVIEDYGVKLLADFCEAQNPQFDRERWLSYIAGTCGKSGGKVKVNA